MNKYVEKEFILFLSFFLLGVSQCKLIINRISTKVIKAMMKGEASLVAQLSYGIMGRGGGG